ncbi:MAG: hypothetical protein Q9166_005704 [cf. Caloplaca sp. 2 TL-2023]
MEQPQLVHSNPTASGKHKLRFWDSTFTDIKFNEPLIVKLQERLTIEAESKAEDESTTQRNQHNIETLINPHFLQAFQQGLETYLWICATRFERVYPQQLLAMAPDERKALCATAIRDSFTEWIIPHDLLIPSDGKEAQ